MSYDEDEDVLSDSSFNPNSDDGDLDDGDLDDGLLDEPNDGFKLDEEEPSTETENI